MDFSFTPDQNELRSLANRILTDACTPERIKKVANTDSATDLVLWKALGEAGLIGIGLPESVGGGGLGWIETCIVLEEIGRVAAPLPAIAVMAFGGPALVNHPDLLDGVATGDAIVTAAVHEPAGDPWKPSLVEADGRLTGTKVCVPSGLVAKRFVVTTSQGLHVVEADARGLTIERQETTSGIPEAMLTFSETPALRIGGTSERDDVIRRGISAACIVLSGSCATALDLTAKYAVNRKQFERLIASFQAVSQRTADAYIDAEAVRLTAWQAAWRIAEGKPTDEQLLSAKYWSAEGGWRVMHAAHHIHGGVGVDRDYPLLRHFLQHKQLELQLGSATPTLRRLGAILAGSEAPAGS